MFWYSLKSVLIHPKGLLESFPPSSSSSSSSSLSSLSSSSSGVFANSALSPKLVGDESLERDLKNSSQAD